MTALKCISLLTNSIFLGPKIKIQRLNLLSYFNIVSKIYPNWIHEMFHFNYATNDLNARNNEHLPFGDRLTNEYLAQLMEVDVL